MTANRGKLMDLLEDRYFNPEKLRAQETYNYRMEGEEESMTKKGSWSFRVESRVPGTPEF